MPWISVNPNYLQINVEQALAEPNSVYHYYRQLIQLRRDHPVVVYGKYWLIAAEHSEIYAYTRTLGETCWLVVNNFYGGTPEFELPSDLDGSGAALVISNYEVNAADCVNQFSMRSYESRVYQLAE